jgi:dihydroxyacetone kinase-like protein
MTQGAVAVTREVVRVLAETAIRNEQYFGELDAVVGDGDFGYSMARGFEALLEAWPNLDATTPGSFLKNVASVLTSRMGGTSGPIWGTAFLRAGHVVGLRGELSWDDAAEMLGAAIEGIKKRGNSDVGDKTLLDSLVPAVDAFAQAVDTQTSPKDIVRAFATEARSGAEGTRQLQARRGRASYAGERSVGALDPGAVAVAVMAEAVANAWKTIEPLTNGRGTA